MGPRHEGAGTMEQATRVTVIYDVHGNLPVLEAVLSNVERVEPDLVVGGDAASGPMSAEVLDRLAGMGDRVRWVRGNADREVVSAYDGGRPAIEARMFARWSRFNSERDFYRYADTKLRDAFPTLPERSQFNRSARSCTELIEAFALHLASLLTDPRRKHPYQALDSSAMPIRDCKHSRTRRGLFLIRLLTRP